MTQSTYGKGCADLLAVRLGRRAARDRFTACWSAHAGARAGACCWPAGARRGGGDSADVAGRPNAGAGARPPRACVRGVVGHRPPFVRRNPLCRTACRAAALAAASARAALGRGARRHPRRARAASRTPASDLDCGRQTDEDCLTLNVWTPPSSKDATAGDGVDPRRRVHQRQRRHLRRALAGQSRATSSSSRSTTGSARWASWRIRRWVRRATSATTGWPTSRRRCAGCATTSPTSAAIPARSPSPANRRAACRCATTSSRRARRGCSGRRSSRARRARRRAHWPTAEKVSLDYAAECGLRRSGDRGALPARIAGGQAARTGAVLLPIRRGLRLTRAGHRDGRAARRPDHRVRQRVAPPGCRC